MIRDIVAEGVRGGWEVHDASRLTADLDIEADVAIAGTGAGGGTAAEILSKAGLRVVLIEEGPLRTSSDFDMHEARAYANLYQESAARRTKDKGVNIFQGRCVGGSTTVNWTSSFRTPGTTLQYWRERFGLADYSEGALAPWFAMMERRLGVGTWLVAPNANNELLRTGAQALGIPTGTIHRNVKRCRNLGYCGMGCPTNAKQSMLVTTIPAALQHGARLFVRARAERLLFDGSRVTGLACTALDGEGIAPGPRAIRVRARHYVIACGAIGSPALLLRSKLPDPNGRVGGRTFLHPSVVSAALMPHPVEGFSGAPQSVYTDRFLEGPLEGPIGYKLEVPPLHPLLVATTLTAFGAPQSRLMSELPNVHVIIALLRDGFHDESTGGTVGLKGDGSPLLDYPIAPYVWDGARRAFATMAKIQFAAGAKGVFPLHEDARLYGDAASADDAIAQLRLEILRARVVSAHVMGGCGMGADPKESVVDGAGRHHHVENVSVFDASVFPTSIGANPQFSIYATVARNASKLVRELTGRDAPSIA
jgi:choline dehydrogenase-like flavoprotein